MRPKCTLIRHRTRALRLADYFGCSSLPARRLSNQPRTLPDRKAVVTDFAVATNHQEPVDWDYARATASIEREHYLLQLRASSGQSQAEFIGSFLKSPLYSTAFDRGFGTLYTAAYRTVDGCVELAWPDRPHRVFALDRFQDLKLDGKL